MSTESGWEGILDDDEKILWQGRPDGKFALEPKALIGGVFGVFFAAFAIFWMAMATMAPGPFWLFGLPFFFVGVSITYGAIYGPTMRRRNTWYTLTDRRAFIASKIPLKGKELKSYPIEPDTELGFIEGDVSTIHFATEQKRRHHESGRSSYYEVPVGFERIPEGRKVYGMIRDIQKGAE